MNKVERAIIMAAGIGTRLRPVTYDTPKPLVNINGTRIIDSIINSLHWNGIYEIIIVVGYLKEQFYFLESQYSGIKIIENEYYNTCNNISSLFVARDYIENAMILDGDQIINNPSILSPEFEISGYNAVWTEEKTDEWLLTVNNGIIKSCSRTGGQCGWRLYSVSRWSPEDGKRLKKHIEQEFVGNHNYQIYWDDVPMFCYPKEYKLGIRSMVHGDIIEIDDFEELVNIDNRYKEYEVKNEKRNVTN